MPALRAAAAAVLALALLGSAGPSALGQEGDTLAVELTPDEAEEALASAEADVEAVRGRLAELRVERATFADRLAERNARRDQAARDLRSARTTAQQLAIQAYMGAGSAPTAATIAFSADDPLTYTFERALLQDSTNARYRAADYYQQLRAQADDAVRTTVQRLDELDEAITLTLLALGEAEDAQRTAAVVLAEAEAAARAARQSAAIAPGSGTPPPDGYVPLGQWPGGPSYEQWAALRQCESSGNYQAVSPSGLYRGAYQFDLSTWASVGGSGDPAMASPAEQDHRAQVLWSQRGASPWPVCGRYLL